jgi:branched-chain amino acid aminotransferase
MFLMDYKDGEWIEPRIVPYGPLTMPPGAMALHYGQSIFEGAKAFKHTDGEIHTFRLNMNAARLNHSAAVVCMPAIDEQMQVEAIHALLDVDRLWFPEQDGACLYIRPFVFATEDHISVRSSKNYTFCILMSPSGAYYKDGNNKAIRLLVSKQYHRAVSGGTGSAKASGNYSASLKAAETAQTYGASQVLYLDSKNEYIEEAGAMNHYHVLKDGTVIIPKFTDTILKSITSRSILELGQQLGCEVRQESIKISDFVEGVKSGDIIEAGGFGTAAVVSPVGSYIFEDNSVITVGDGNVGKYTLAMYTLLTDIQMGRQQGPAGWVNKVERIKQ